VPEDPVDQAARHIREGEGREEAQKRRLGLLIEHGSSARAIEAGTRTLAVLSKTVELSREHLQIIWNKYRSPKI
jgi:hypothetical protein